MIELLPRLRAHFDTLEDRLICFTNMGVQVESWFKGELLTLLSSLRAQGRVTDFDREVRTQGGRIDLTIGTRTGLHWVEVKHWLIGKQKGSTYDPAFYFGDLTSVGIAKDVDKLLKVTSPGRLWLLILLTANPGKEPWSAGVAKFNSKFSPRRVDSLTEPGDFPGSYFIGLLEVYRVGFVTSTASRH
jgi:hypothetical protein